MKKYIRLEDNILEEKMFDSPICVFIRKEIEPYIIKQADSIKDLCDGFYIDDGSDEIYPGALFSKDEYEFFVSSIEDHKKYNQYFIAYGVIKTKSGFNFAAKMNKEGDLELIWKQH